MEGKSKLAKVGRLMVKDGKYTDKNGKEKIRWHEIGIVLATPHHSNMCVKLHSNGYGEGQFASVFYDEEARPNFTDGGTQATNIDGVKSQVQLRKEAIAQSAQDIPPQDVPF